MEKGTELKKRIKPLVESVQELRLPYVPCRMFKNEKFGGFVAENYRALTMLSPWIFRCLLDKEYSPTPPMLPSTGKPRDKWTMKENAAWLKVRGIKFPHKSTAAERTSLVDGYYNEPNGPPAVVPNTTPSAHKIRHLLVLLFRLFGTLFSTDLKGAKAGNRFDALAVQFLNCVEDIGKACLPNKKRPIWLSKYGMMGLLRCRQHFVDYTYPHSLYEGGIEGEGMVKELRPLCPNAVRAGWPLNLMNAYNRQNILASLTSGFQSCTSHSLPTDGQHQANGKRYSTWADVDFALKNGSPVSIVVLGTTNSWQCHVLVHMFRVTYSKAVIINLMDEPVVDDVGFVYHAITLEDNKREYDDSKPVMSFALMLPNKDGEGVARFCFLDKDWRFIGVDQNWSILNCTAQ
jgi:hypothetical protein